jgi:hypothetical protein
MQLHLDEIATKVTPGALAILILDQASWHGAKRPQGSEKHLAPAAAAFARTQPSRKHQAIHASELVIIILVAGKLCSAVDGFGRSVWFL